MALPVANTDSLLTSGTTAPLNEKSVEWATR
jgi:hypothetical protein